MLRRAPFAAVVVLFCACASARAPRDALSGGASQGTSDAVDDGGDASPSDAGLADDADADGASDASDASDEPRGAADGGGACAQNMALVAGVFCIDRYEGSLLETLPDGTERAYPHYLPVDGHDVRAVSQPGVLPQGFISELQADDACQASGKRLCTLEEWRTACIGPDATTFPYGSERIAGVCHDAGKSPVAAVFGAAALASTPPSSARTTPAHSTPAHGTSPGKKGTPGKGKPKKDPRPAAKGATGNVHPTNKSAKPRTPARRSARPTDVSMDVWTRLNDPRLGQVDGALSPTGQHAACTSAYGALDMVGNLHEWVATDRRLPHGTFAGGYFLDTHLNGDGCNYRTLAHAHDYHDYSTGFRCCSDPAP